MNEEQQNEVKKMISMLEDAIETDIQYPILICSPGYRLTLDEMNGFEKRLEKN